MPPPSDVDIRDGVYGGGGAEGEEMTRVAFPHCRDSVKMQILSQ